MSTLTVRFIGIYCFLDRRGKGDDFEARVVLPADGRAGERNDGPHVPYLEFEVLDEPRIRGRFVKEKMYPRDLLVYRRVHLASDRITIRNTTAPKHGKLNILQSVEDRLPSLTTLTPKLSPEIDPSLLGPQPPHAKVAAYFDIPYGDLHTGPSNLVFTRFDRTDGAPTVPPPRRLPSWIELQIPIKEGERPVVEVESFRTNGSDGRTITLLPSTDRITFGNQLEEDIERNMFDPANLRAEDFRAHFELYYDILPNRPNVRTLPASTSAPLGGCGGVRYP